MVAERMGGGTGFVGAGFMGSPFGDTGFVSSPFGGWELISYDL